MLTFGIVLAIVAIVACSISVVLCLINQEFGGAFFMMILAILNVFILVNDIDKYKAKKNGEVERKTVENVIGYSIDSTTVINGVDTTKTYTITYWKDYE